MLLNDRLYDYATDCEKQSLALHERSQEIRTNASRIVEQARALGRTLGLAEMQGAGMSQDDALALVRTAGNSVASNGASIEHWNDRILHDAEGKVAAMTARAVELEANAVYARRGEFRFASNQLREVTWLSRYRTLMNECISRGRAVMFDDDGQEHRLLVSGEVPARHA
jgi:hypothetical protein